MPFNVLLLPLLGGYIFITHWNRTRFRARRYSGNKLILNSALAGALLLILSLLTVSFIYYYFPRLESLWISIVPFAYSDISTLAFLLGCIAWWPLNKSFNRQSKAINRAIKESNDFLEILLEKALSETKQISITLKSSKIYIGFVTSNFDPSYDRKYLKILPLLSGYRDAVDKSVVITTDYSRVYEKVINNEKEFSHLNPDDFEVVVPIFEVQSINIFDPDAYVLFNLPLIDKHS